MTAALLDTHALVWFLDDDPRLSKAARSVIAPRANRMLVSAASIWELSIKISAGRLDLRSDPLEAGEAEGIEHLPVTLEHAWASRSLPLRRDHKDPFDRMIAAQALFEGLAVISADSSFDDYGVERIW